MTEPIESPCIRHCALDKHDRCWGCGRTLEQILGWYDMTPQERRAIMAELPGERFGQNRERLS